METDIETAKEERMCCGQTAQDWCARYKHMAIQSDAQQVRCKELEEQLHKAQEEVRSLGGDAEGHIAKLKADKEAAVAELQRQLDEANKGKEYFMEQTTEARLKYKQLDAVSARKIEQFELQLEDAAMNEKALKQEQAVTKQKLWEATKQVEMLKGAVEKRLADLKEEAKGASLGFVAPAGPQPYKVGDLAVVLPENSEACCVCF
jgi:hypothetical protein